MRFDVALVGGGLQSSLIALALLARAPDVRLAVVERGATLGGNHTWSFHRSDLSPAMQELVHPLITARWPAYDVRFPGLRRRIRGSYFSLSSERLHAVVSERLGRAPGARLLLGTHARAVTRGSVILSDGTPLEAELVVDARGPGALPGGARAYQKFLGLELELEEDHGLEAPRVMDADVDQVDGFHFVYVLPFSARRLLIEDTCYSEDPTLDEEALAARVGQYADRMGLKGPRAMRRETGVLPLPLEAPGREAGGDGILRAGYAGGWFHPTTGYSVPAAARLAEVVARTWPGTLASSELTALRGEQARQARFATALNRLLFRAYPPPERWRALERFYRLPVSTIERFYALRTRRLDRARILFGRPPRGVRLARALRELLAPGRAP